MNIVLATQNPHKIDEISAIINCPAVKFVLPTSDFNPIENGKTFAENSLIKAICASKLMNELSLADDTGLCVDALNGAPGLLSARYAPTQADKINKILMSMKNIPSDKRSARFICVMTLTDNFGNVLHVSEGICEGKITLEPFGSAGFGYDPIFFVNSLSKTMAQMSNTEKNSLSHRAFAALDMINFIKLNLL